MNCNHARGVIFNTWRYQTRGVVAALFQHAWNCNPCCELLAHGENLTVREKSVRRKLWNAAAFDPEGMFPKHHEIINSMSSSR
jgi:hypothetical protein